MSVAEQIGSRVRDGIERVRSGIEDVRSRIRGRLGLGGQLFESQIFSGQIGGGKLLEAFPRIKEFREKGIIRTLEERFKGFKGEQAVQTQTQIQTPAPITKPLVKPAAQAEVKKKEKEEPSIF